ncbi:hypothetical protein Hte_008163 [Hypoxylon texense]
MVPPKPNPKAVPYIWKCVESLPLLMKAAEIVPAEEAERRVLMLVNPSKGYFHYRLSASRENPYTQQTTCAESPYTTDTIYGSESDRLIIWLDALNLPLFRYAPVNYAEMYSESRYPSTHCEECEWRHPWKSVEQSLNSQEEPHAIYHYTVNGKPLSASLSAQSERIDGNHSTAP